MSTTWRETAGEIAARALSLIGAVPAEETPEAYDLATALDALDGLLKELPAYGLTWPRLSTTNIALAWSSATPDRVSLPADYAGNPVIWYALPTGRQGLRLLLKVERDALSDPDQTATYPETAYIDPAGTAWLYPVPTQDPVLTLSYQQIISDSVSGSNPDMAQMWTQALGYGVAVEIAPVYGVPLPIAQDLERKWVMRRARLLAAAIEAAPISFAVDD